jgi:hypothetical protein
MERHGGKRWVGGMEREALNAVHGILGGHREGILDRILRNFQKHLLEKHQCRK